VALNYFTHQSSRAAFPSSNVDVFKDGETPLFYVFSFEPVGFVIVAADDAVTPVLGYSTESKFDFNSIPDNAKRWLLGYESQIKSIVNSRLDNSITKKEWTGIQTNRFSPNRGSVSPLTATNWSQGKYYNTACPSDDKAVNSDGHVYTGCVATAMAQIMKFHGYPVTGIGSHSYTHPTYGIQTANFGAATYNWVAMPLSVFSSSTEVAKLMYHCGVSVDMNYGVDGSGAQSSRVPTALVNYFGYSPTAEIKEMSDFTASGWIGLLKSELDGSRPMYYAGDDGESGHAFVCDGYDAANQFHFNWGWGGSANGYFAIGSLNPSLENTYNQGNEVVVRIKPMSDAPIADFTANTIYPEIGGSINFTDKSIQTPTSWMWTFEGGTPASSTEQNPQNVTYATAGAYLVSLKVSNASGNDIKTMSKYILVGGSSNAWIRQNTGFTTPSRGIDQIKIVSPLIVWARAYNYGSPDQYIREFTRTTDGGISWITGTISFTGSESYGVSNIFPLSDLVCYACMFPLEGTGGKIVKTIDGGIIWTEQSTATFPGSWADFVHFFNENDGVAMGDPVTTDFVIYTTSDGGVNWLPLVSANIPNCQSGEAGVTNMYTAVGNTIWFSSSKGRVFKSTDKGLNWTVASTGLAKLVSLSFKDANTGFAVLTTTPYTVKKTIDGGATWTTLTPAGFDEKYPHFKFLTGTAATWVSLGPGSGSSFSLNDCATFTNIDTGSVRYTEVEFLDKETGWAGSVNFSSTDGGIYKWNYNWLITTDVEPIVAATTEKMHIYPNPSNGQVFVDLVNAERPSSIAIYNMVGAKVRVIIPAEETGPYSVNMNGLRSGIYLVSAVKDGKVLSTQRVSIIE